MDDHERQDRLFQLTFEIVENATVELRQLLLWYTGLADSGISYRDLQKTAQDAPASTEGSIMNIVEQLRQQSRQETLMELLVRQLQHKFGELSDDAAHKVASASSSDLELWAERVLAATSLDEVFQHAAAP